MASLSYSINSQDVSENYKHVNAAFDFEERRRDFSTRLSESMEVRVVESSEDELEFDLTGVDASIANALRRIMLAEVPTIAIEHVYIEMNSSIIHDEVLAHRLGLVPIRVDPELFVERLEGEEANSANTVVFSLDVTCSSSPEDASTTATVPHPSISTLSSSSPSSSLSSAPYTMPVYSSHLVWCPQGDQEEQFGVNGIRPVHEDILLAKLRPGQSIKLEAHCQKGVGKDHAKFSPVATASYRLLPSISVTKKEAAPGDDEDSDMGDDKEIEKGFSQFDLVDPASSVGIITRPRECTICREGTRREDWADKIALTRIPDYFIFKVESTGTMPPKEIVKQSLRILKKKCDSFLGVLENSIDAVEPFLQPAG
jgi:DNA-directed RNA polymerase I and III subunit RPAC1